MGNHRSTITVRFADCDDHIREYLDGASSLAKATMCALRTYVDVVVNAGSLLQLNELPIVQQSAIKAELQHHSPLYIAPRGNGNVWVAFTDGEACLLHPDGEMSDFVYGGV